MTFYTVLFIAWACPGGWLAGLWPAAAKPLLCKAQPSAELFDPARQKQARARVIALGPPTQMHKCVDLECGPCMVDWLTEAKFKEAP